MKSYILGAARTPRGQGKPGTGALTGVHPQELLATVLRELPARAGEVAGFQAILPLRSAAAQRMPERVAGPAEAPLWAPAETAYGDRKQRRDHAACLSAANSRIHETRVFESPGMFVPHTPGKCGQTTP